MASSKQKPTYGDLIIKEAYQDVKEKEMPIRKAARIYGIPEATLRWRLANGRMESVM